MKNEEQEWQYWVIKVLLVVVTGFVLYACIGCQMVRGLAHDTATVCNYVQDQIPPTDTRDGGK